MEKYLQESRLDIPFSLTIKHERSAEREHDGNHVGQRKTPACSLGSKSLSRDFSSIGVADSGSAGS